MSTQGTQPSSVPFIGDLDPKLVEESQKKFEARKEKIKNYVNETTPFVKEGAKRSTDASIVEGSAAAKVVLTTLQPEIARVVNPLIGIAQGPVLKAKHKHVDPVIDSTVEGSAKGSKYSVDTCF